SLAHAVCLDVRGPGPQPGAAPALRRLPPDHALGSGEARAPRHPRRLRRAWPRPERGSRPGRRRTPRHRVPVAPRPRRFRPGARPRRVRSGHRAAPAGGGAGTLVERTRRMTRPSRLRRSELSTPGTSEKMIVKAAASPADLVFLDLEDAVAPSEKEKARQPIIDALNELDWGAKTRAVRVNGTHTQWCA